jgi:hypothetical protein
MFGKSGEIAVSHQSILRGLRAGFLRITAAIQRKKLLTSSEELLLFLTADG